MVVVGLITLGFVAITYYNSRTPGEIEITEAPTEIEFGELPEDFDFLDFSLANPLIEIITLPTGLRYQDLVMGEGEEAGPGHNVVVHYTGWLTNELKFDSSVDRNSPFEFTLGAGQVIRGWDEGVAGMHVGGVRLLMIPPELGYGETGSGAIPPGATLIFRVELLEIK